MPRTHNVDSIISSINGVQKIGYSHAKDWELDSYLTKLRKVNLKWIKVLNGRPVTMKLLEENMEKFLNSGLLSDFFTHDTKSTRQQRQK